MKIILVRHGENEGLRLSQLGIWQMEHMVKTIRNCSLWLNKAVVLSSPESLVKQSAEIIAIGLGLLLDLQEKEWLTSEHMLRSEQVVARELKKFIADYSDIETFVVVSSRDVIEECLHYFVGKEECEAKPVFEFKIDNGSVFLIDFEAKESRKL